MPRLAYSSEITGYIPHIIRPASAHDLITVTSYIRDILTHGIDKNMVEADLLNLKEKRTPENILPILKRILWLQSCKEEGVQDTQYSKYTVFTERKGERSLVSLLGSRNAKYVHNLDLLLRDLGVYNAYYGKDDDTPSFEKTKMSASDRLNNAFNEAFTIVINNLNNDSNIPHISEFEVNKNGIVRFSEGVKQGTIRTGGKIIGEVQRVLDELLEFGK